MITILIVLVVIIIIPVVMYNNLVGSRNAIENAFGSIDAMLKKRYDLIPNLVETAKAYMKYEKETLTSITEMRAKAVSGNISNDEKVEVENKLAGMMRNVMVAVENYPELKANDQFVMLQRSWNEAEEQISAARRSFNAAVTSYNNAVEKFPSSILASMFGFKRRQVFEIPDVERQNISAKAMFGN